MADAPDLAQFLDVEVQEIAAGGRFVVTGRARRIEATQALETDTALLAPHRGDA
jgi:hypothetical protein